MLQILLCVIVKKPPMHADHGMMVNGKCSTIAVVKEEAMFIEWDSCEPTRITPCFFEVCAEFLLQF